MIKEVDLLPSQLKAIKSEQNVTLLLCARGVGKSYGTAFYCIYRLLTDAEVGMLVCPIYSMLRDTTSYLLQHLNYLGIQYSLNKMPSWCQSTLSDHKNVLSINTGTQKHVYLFLCSGDNPDFLRGKSVHFIAMDEAALLDEEIIDICTPALRGHPKGPNYNYRILLATTSTTCHNWIYKRYIEKDAKGFTEIKAFAEENIFEYTEEKIEILKSQMTDLMFRREMLCQWISLTENSVFYNFTNSNIGNSQKEGKLWVSCDLNVKGLTSIWGWENRDTIYIEGEVVISENGNATKMVDKLDAKLNSNQNKVIFLTGDRNIKNNNAIGADTYHQQVLSGLRSKGWKVIDQTLNCNPSVYASADKVNWALAHNKIIVNPSCEVLIDDLRTANWKENLGDKFVIDKDSCKYQCDAGDCLRYLCENKWPVGSIVKLNPK